MPWSATATFFGFAGLAIAATILAIYIYKKTHPNKSLKYSSQNNCVSHNGINYSYDPVSKKIVESSAATSKASKKKRQSRSPTEKTLSEKSSSAPESIAENRPLNVSKEVQTDPVDVNLNNLDHPMSLQEKVNEYFRRNIPVVPDSESSDPILNSECPGPDLEPVNTEILSDSSEWSNISSVKSSDDTIKAYKKKIHKSFKKYVHNFIQENWETHSVETTGRNSVASNDDNLSSTGSSWSNISSEKSTDDFEKAYKKKVHKTLRKFVKNMQETENSTAPSEYSDDTLSVLSGDLKLCKTCENNPVNTRTQPCNHRYLCSDCAMKFYKLHKKCKICRTRIDQYVVED